MEKLTDVLAMGGYSAYVWPSYGFACLVLFLLAVISWRGLRRAQSAFAELEKAVRDET